MNTGRSALLRIGVLGFLAMSSLGLQQAGALAATVASAPAGTAVTGTTASRTHLVVHPSPATTAQRVTLFADVVPGTAGAPAPAGTVTFLDGTATVGSAVLATSAKGRQVASIVVHFARGTHSLTASYGGDAATSPSTSSAVALQVSAAPRTATTTTDTEVAGPSPHTATIATLVKNTQRGYPDATGSVTFRVDGRAPQAVPLNDRRRAHLTVTLPAGTHHVTVAYPGDSLHRPSQGSLTFTTT